MGANNRGCLFLGRCIEQGFCGRFYDFYGTFIAVIELAHKAFQIQHLGVGLTLLRVENRV